jgi:hypothetical protein
MRWRPTCWVSARCWLGSRGLDRLLIVAGEDQYEERLVADTIAKLSRAPGIDPHHIDILTVNGERS